MYAASVVPTYMLVYIIFSYTTQSYFMHAITTGSTGSYDMSKQYEEGWFVPITYVQEDKI